ncbi:hypothetical protein ACGFNU_26115 [Spirillospora sp. NPDC048911]|uniref:hypothetical protein n=1 Tax=Spirillospora sp. NPDC048911 TaxID=3364527 RepID=UPI00371286DB
MPIQHVIAYTRLAARFARDTAEAGARPDGAAAATAAKRVVHAACAAQMHALGVADLAPDEPASTLEGTARRLSELATDSAWASRAILQALAHEEWCVAGQAVDDARLAAGAALEAAENAERQIVAPGSALCAEAARLAMEQATAQAVTDIGLHRDARVAIPS